MSTVATRLVGPSCRRMSLATDAAISALFKLDDPQQLPVLLPCVLQHVKQSTRHCVFDNSSFQQLLDLSVVTQSCSSQC